MKVMFICTGNICRSAMAYGLFKKKISDNKLSNIEVYSCGTYAAIGDTPTYEARRVMEENNVDISKHKSTNIRYSDIKKMDLILCATLDHKTTVINMYPELKDKVFTLKEYVDYNREYHDSINIKDPWGYDIDTYRSCASEIDECLNLLINKIK